MERSGDALLVWAPRVLGIALCLFLSVFALDAFGGGRSTPQALADFAIHVAPMILLLVVVALSWRWEWVGGVVFTALAVAYGVWTRHHPQWIAVVGYRFSSSESSSYGVGVTTDCTERPEGGGEQQGNLRAFP
jgi:hypothetical protein